MKYLAYIICLLLLTVSQLGFSQDLYSARGYWEESSKSNYLSIKLRFNRGDSLTSNETNYLKDYESYLATYHERMSEEQRQEYARMKDQWNRELATTEAPIVKNNNKPPQENFEWRSRDRLVNIFYGAYYGGSLVAIAGIKDAAAVGIPLITGGLWLLGPAINQKKYEGITRNTIRASNTGKLLGLGYGAALGLALGGESQETSKIVLGFSTVGSIVLGETAFQLQKKRNTSRGQIEMMRHYGILTPLLAASFMATGQVNNSNLYGLAMLGGGVTGLVIGKNISKKYDYSQGDVASLSSLTVISAGIGFTFVAEALKNNTESSGLLLIPAATSILGTVLGQKAVRGVHLTEKQGSTLQLSTAGAALVGLGIVAIANGESAGVIIGVPSALALITHQILFHDFKMKNLELNLKRSELKKRDYKFSFNVTPENYLLNKKIPYQNYTPQAYSKMQNSLFNLKFTF